jgi:hypothetical protein
VPEANPCTTIGDELPVCVWPPEEVTLKDVAAYGPAGVNDTEAAPLLYARFVPISVAVPIVGAYGDKKSFDD